jgi:hypothetical protein
MFVTQTLITPLVQIAYQAKLLKIKASQHSSSMKLQVVPNHNITKKN